MPKQLSRNEKLAFDAYKNLFHCRAVESSFRLKVLRFYSYVALEPTGKGKLETNPRQIIIFKTSREAFELNRLQVVEMFHQRQKLC